MELLLTVLTALFMLAVAQQDVRIPPTIEVPPTMQVFRDSEEFTLACVASGAGEIRYEWFKDGAFFDLNQPYIEKDPLTGTITFTAPTRHDQGYYQCFASNNFGTTMSDIAQVIQARISSYPSIPTREHTFDQRSPGMLACQTLNSYPTPTYSWEISESESTSAATRPVSLSARINIDDDGNLHFANILDIDDAGGDIYKCVQFNPIKDISVGGSYARIAVNSDSSPPTVAPVLAFKSDPSYAFLRENLVLRCMFSGYPTPTIRWFRQDGQPIPIERVEYTRFDTTMTLKNIDWSDEAVYACQGNSGGVTKTEYMDIEVRERPNFKPRGRPEDTTVTDGETAVFRCNVNAKPSATIKWFSNGGEIDWDSAGPRMSLSEGDTVLSLREACKTCPGGSSDLQVFQCNASNEDGYQFSSGYLNVLNPTVIDNPPQDVELEYFKDVVFNCSATSDDLTEVSYRWILNDKYPIYPDNDMIFIESDGQVLRIVTKDESDGGLSQVGEYKCEASNGYSTDSAAANLTRPMIEPPEPTPVVGTASIADLWWVFVIIAAIILLIILCLVCILCIQRNKGESYPVDEKERWNGNDPEKELIDSGFQDYQRPEDGPLKGSQASLTSTIKMDSDEESLAEYGDLDAGKFNEDGSFIGQYATDKKKKGKSETNV